MNLLTKVFAKIIIPFIHFHSTMVK